MAKPLSLPNVPKCVRKRTIDQKKDALIGRLWKSAEQQISEFEKCLSHDVSVDLEHNARSLAILVKVLRELVILDAHVRFSSEKGRAPGDLTSFSSVPLYDSSTVDQLRQTLAERLARLGKSGEDASISESV